MADQQNDKDQAEDRGRRQFLTLAGLGTATAAAALASGGRAQAAGLSQAQTSGYRETDHIRAYYDSARF